MLAVAALVAGPLGPATVEAADTEEQGVARGASAEDELKRRLLAKVRTIPGTDTEYLIGGYVQVDGILARRRQDGEEQDTFFVSATPFGTADSAARLSVKQSQFNWISRTPTPVGEVWTRLEANLFPLDGRTAPELGQLWIRLDDYVIVGKTYSTFMDDAALPTTLDYNGPSGVTFARQWLARAAVPLGEAWVLEASVEDAQADFDAEGNLFAASTDARRPDLAARLRYEGEGGHFQVAGISRRIAVRATGPGGTVERVVDGAGVSVSGSLALSERGELLAQYAAGKGIGRYFNDPLSAVAVSVADDRTLERVRVQGATLYYQHEWAPRWRSVAGASTLWMDDDGRRPPTALERSIYATANLCHFVTPTLIVGGELQWGQVRRIDGDRASNTRGQFSLRYLIF